METSPVP